MSALSGCVQTPGLLPEVCSPNTLTWPILHISATRHFLREAFLTLLPDPTHTRHPLTWPFFKNEYFLLIFFDLSVCLIQTLPHESRGLTQPNTLAQTQHLINTCEGKQWMCTYSYRVWRCFCDKTHSELSLGSLMCIPLPGSWIRNVSPIHTLWAPQATAHIWGCCLKVGPRMRQEKEPRRAGPLARVYLCSYFLIPSTSPVVAPLAFFFSGTQSFLLGFLPSLCRFCSILSHPLPSPPDLETGMESLEVITKSVYYWQQDRGGGSVLCLPPLQLCSCLSIWWI